jgi:hypothetical protein
LLPPQPAAAAAATTLACRHSLLLLLLTGLCASSLQLKQKVVSQPLQATSSGSSGARSMQHSTAFSQFTPAAAAAAAHVQSAVHGTNKSNRHVAHQHTTTPSNSTCSF